MNFVNPLFLLGVLAAAVPILLHLRKRERARRIEFPTLIFLRKISRKTIRFQKLRHLLLLLMRILAFACLVLAFMRPYTNVPPQAAAAEGRVSRAMVILLDNSMSMSYGDRWARAQKAATDIVRGGPRQVSR
jgi:drug/metabolite transporter (DMT)-like permease